MSFKTACRVPKGLIGPFAFVFCFLIVSGCSVNPATKRRQFMIVSEEQEFRLGQKADKQVREEMRFYLELPELRALVKEVGESIGRNSDRPNLIYRLEIVDAPDYNAFAIPGGFVYVNRGLLERMNSLDELASVIGHEIAHVAARHSAAQISMSQLMNIGLVGLAVATDGAAQNYGQLLNLGAALAFNKFSRDDEREADHFGVAYMTRAGYNPKGAVDSMRQIERMERGEPSAVENWFRTHPPTAERVSNLQGEIKTIGWERPEILQRPMGRNKLIALLDGLAIGEWNGTELISGNRYYNKEYSLGIEIPEGWLVQINHKKYTAIFAQPKKKFFAIFDIEPLRSRKSTQEYFYDFDRRLQKLGLSRISRSTAGRISNQGAVIGIYSGNVSSLGAITAECMVFTRGTNGYSFLGISKNVDFGKFQTELESIMSGLEFITQKEASELNPPRLRIHKVQKGERWSNIAMKYFGSSRETQKLAEYNGFEASQHPAAGTLVKIPPSLRFR